MWSGATERVACHTDASNCAAGAGTSSQHLDGRGSNFRRATIEASKWNAAWSATGKRGASQHHRWGWATVERISYESLLIFRAHPQSVFVLRRISLSTVDSVTSCARENCVWGVPSAKAAPSLSIGIPSVGMMSLNQDASVVTVKVWKLPVWTTMLVICPLSSFTSSVQNMFQVGKRILQCPWVWLKIISKMCPAWPARMWGESSVV